MDQGTYSKDGAVDVSEVVDQDRLKVLLYDEAEKRGRAEQNMTIIRRRLAKLRADDSEEDTKESREAAKKRDDFIRDGLAKEEADKKAAEDNKTE